MIVSMRNEFQATRNAGDALLGLSFVDISPRDTSCHSLRAVEVRLNERSSTRKQHLCDC